jgi:polysaccharide biosynthesis protein PslJ
VTAATPAVERRAAAEISWHAVVGLVIVVIFFIPIKRYTLPGSLPFDLEPYRVIVALCVGCWLTSLLLDRRLRLRGTPLDVPLGMILVAVLGSILLNSARVSATGLTAPKALTFFLSYVCVYYLLASVVTDTDAVDRLVRLIVACGGVLGGLALLESRTNYNVFDHLHTFMPFLSYRVFNDNAFSATELDRGGRLRVYASAQHPIALAALFVMLLPLCVYLVRRTRQKRWWLAALLVTLGMLGTQSRTGIIMLLVVALVFLLLRPRETGRLWPALPLVLVVVHFALPQTLGNLRAAFFPKGGLVAEQAHVVRPGDLAVGHGRLATVGPTLDQLSNSPFFGIGYGTRITAGPGVNAIVLDDAWLGTLLETGVVGAVGWILFFGFAVRRLGRRARRDQSDIGWLHVALTASIASFAVGMLTYDAFSFVQVTFVAFILLGLAGVLLRDDG